MPRPVSTDDLNPMSLSERVFAVHPEQFRSDAGMLRAWADVLTAAYDRGWIVADDYGTVEISRPKTDEELAAALASDQRQWDIRHGAYNRACGPGEELTPSEAYLARRHAKLEGLPVPPRAEEKVKE